MYKCMSCSKDLEEDDKIRCSYCGYRIVTKTRENFKKQVRGK